MVCVGNHLEDQRVFAQSTDCKVKLGQQSPWYSKKGNCSLKWTQLWQTSAVCLQVNTSINHGKGKSSQIQLTLLPCTYFNTFLFSPLQFTILITQTSPNCVLFCYFKPSSPICTAQSLLDVPSSPEGSHSDCALKKADSLPAAIAH